MAKNVKINGVTYENVPQVEIPLADNSGNSATFLDTDIASDGAAAGDILAGKKSYVNGALVTGSMPNNGAISEEISTKEGTVNPAAGYHNGSGSVGLAAAEKAKLISDNIRATVTLFGIQGDPNVVDTELAAGVAASAAQILSGKKAYVNGTELTGTMTAATVSQDSTTKVLSIA